MVFTVHQGTGVTHGKYTGLGKKTISIAVYLSCVTPVPTQPTGISSRN